MLFNRAFSAKHAHAGWQPAIRQTRLSALRCGRQGPKLLTRSPQFETLRNADEPAPGQGTRPTICDCPLIGVSASAISPSCLTRSTRHLAQLPFDSGKKRFIVSVSNHTDTTVKKALFWQIVLPPVVCVSHGNGATYTTCCPTAGTIPRRKSCLTVPNDRCRRSLSRRSIIL